MGSQINMNHATKDVIVIASSTPNTVQIAHNVVEDFDDTKAYDCSHCRC